MERSSKDLDGVGMSCAIPLGRAAKPSFGTGQVRRNAICWRRFELYMGGVWRKWGWGLGKVEPEKMDDWFNSELISFIINRGK